MIALEMETGGRLVLYLGMGLSAHFRVVVTGLTF
jgi:hypothetical protein